MNEKIINKIVEIIRHLKEEGVDAVPTNSTASTPGKPGFSELSPAGGPTAGISPKLGKVRRRGPVIGLGKNSRNRWKPTQ